MKLFKPLIKYLRKKFRKKNIVEIEAPYLQEWAEMMKNVESDAENLILKDKGD